MGIHLADQTMAFLGACLLGALLGAAYDIFRIFRVAFPLRPAVVFVQDIIYFILCGLATFLYLLTATEGMVRVFLLLGVVIGWVLYHLTVGQLVIGVSRTLIAGVKAVLRFLYKHVIFPLWRMMYNIIAFVLRPVRFFVRVVKKVLRKIKFNLKVDRIVLYNQLEGFTTKWGSAVRRRKQENYGEAEEGP